MELEDDKKFLRLEDHERSVTGLGRYVEVSKLFAEVAGVWQEALQYENAKLEAIVKGLPEREEYYSNWEERLTRIGNEMANYVTFPEITNEDFANLARMNEISELNKLFENSEIEEDD